MPSVVSSLKLSGTRKVDGGDNTSSGKTLCSFYRAATALMFLILSGTLPAETSLAMASPQLIAIHAVNSAVHKSTAVKVRK